jgi:hypothetical protein
MSTTVITLGEVANAAGDAYQNYTGGTSATAASFGAAVATITSIGLSRFDPFGSGFGTGTRAGAAGIALGANLTALQSASTPAQGLSAALGIIGAAAGIVAPFLPLPQQAALVAGK